MFNRSGQRWQTGNLRDECGPQTGFHWSEQPLFELSVNIYKLEDLV